jgi:serine/threonine protein kinase/Flp pilus assembly protein TadD
VALNVSEWTRIQELFHNLADRSQSEQSEELDRLTTDEPDVAREVRGMLLADASGASLLDRGIASAADDLLRPADALPPHKFGPYRLEKLLGEGGMGVVYLGHRADLDSRAAIKILANAWLSPARRERFQQETQTMSVLDHPSIARLLDADHLPDGTPWFAMEYVEGEPITTWARRHALDLRALLRLYVEVCDAVQHAHSRAVIHRDIKPSNVLVTENGSVKLLDFGIAKRFRDARGDTRSRTAMRMLTPQYAAPEQLDGRVVGVGADVYALGVMLFELIAGRRPYELDDSGREQHTATILAAYPPNVRRALRAPAAGGGDTPATTIGADALPSSEWADIDALLATALAPDPADRYASVEAFRADIERFLDNKPLAARTATLTYRARKFLRRRWRGVGLTAAVVSVSALGLFVYNRNLKAARDVAVAEAARTTRLQQFLINLFQGGPQGVVPGDSLRLATVVQNGIREARGLASDSVTQAELLMTLGIISEQIGSATQADSLYLLAIDRTRAVHGPNDPETVRGMVRRAALLAKLDKADSAELLLMRLDTVARRYVPADHPALAELNEALGKLLGERGKIPLAVPLLQRAVAQRARADTTSREYSSALRELGNAMAYGGRWQEADSIWRLSLALEQRLYGPKHPNVGFLLTNLGTVASMRGDLPTAERDLRQAVDISAAWFGEHHWLTAAARLPLAQTFIREQKFADAVPVLRGMIADYSSQPLPTGGVAMNLVQGALGNALTGLGDYAGARAAYDAALRDLRATLGPKHMNTLLTESSVGRVLIDQGKADSAIALYRSILERGTAAYGAAHPEVAGFKLRLGRALFVAHRPKEAIDAITAGMRVLDSAKAGRPDDIQRALATLDTAYRAVGDTAAAAQVRARLARAKASATK